MPGRGVTPREQIARPSNAKQRVRGQFVETVGVGWQHGATPKPPVGLLPETRNAWKVWMGSWFSANWMPEDIPGLRQVIRLYDQVERGEYVRSTELRLGMDNYGITPKGQQDRRWRKPEPSVTKAKPKKYGKLEAVGE